MSKGNERNGVIPAAGYYLSSGLDFDLPATITLTSSDAGRKIELSTDGTNFFTPVYDATMTGMINVSISARVRVYKITGAVGDAWSVL